MNIKTFEDYENSLMESTESEFDDLFEGLLEDTDDEDVLNELFAGTADVRRNKEKAGDFYKQLYASAKVQVAKTEKKGKYKFLKSKSELTTEDKRDLQQMSKKITAGLTASTTFENTPAGLMIIAASNDKVLAAWLVARPVKGYSKMNRVVQGHGAIKAVRVHYRLAKNRTKEG